MYRPSTATCFFDQLTVGIDSSFKRSVDLSQFNFGPDELSCIADHDIHLDHEQALLYGSGLRANYVLPDGGSIPNGAHLPGCIPVNPGVSHAFAVADVQGFTARFDIINLFDEKYEMRDGTGVEGGAPERGQRHGFFGGLSKEL